MNLAAPALVLSLAAFGLGTLAGSEPSPAPATSSAPFVGEIMWVPYNFAPRGWEFCDGRLIPISNNTALFSLIGTTYGGDGKTTFALPDLRGRTAVSSGQGKDLPPFSLGQRGGSPTVALTPEEIPSHAHALSTSSDAARREGPARAVLASGGTLTSNEPTGTASVIGVAGGGKPHENMPPYVVLNAVIAVEGIFPSRN